MSFDWVKDIAEMQYKYGVKAWMLENQDDKEKMRKYLEFRINFLREELDETQKAFAESDPEIGVKPERPNPLGLPDLIKPEGWEAPSHEGNHGKFNNIR